MRYLETRILPPVVTLMVGVVMWVVARLAPTLAVTPAYRYGIGTGIALAGVGLELVAAVTFSRVCTTVNPLRPADATSLVTNGVYRYTRNPIYLGDVLALVGWAVVLGSPVTLACVAALVAYLDRFQIEPEERILSAKFGKAYETYRTTVRRWL